MSVQQSSNLVAIGRVVISGGSPIYQAQRGVKGIGPQRYPLAPVGQFIVEVDDTTGGLSTADCSFQLTPNAWLITADSITVDGEMFTDTDGVVKIRVRVTSVAAAVPAVLVDAGFNFTIHRLN